MYSVINICFSCDAFYSTGYTVIRVRMFLSWFCFHAIYRWLDIIRHNNTLQYMYHQHVLMPTGLRFLR